MHAQLMPPPKDDIERIKNPAIAVVLDTELAVGSVLEWETGTQLMFNPAADAAYIEAVRGRPLGTWGLNVPQLASIILDVSVLQVLCLSVTQPTFVPLCANLMRLCPPTYLCSLRRSWEWRSCIVEAFLTTI
jgi:hypothetical protein